MVVGLPPGAWVASLESTTEENRRSLAQKPLTEDSSWISHGISWIPSTFVLALVCLELVCVGLVHSVQAALSSGVKWSWHTIPGKHSHTTDIYSLWHLQSSCSLFHDDPWPLGECSIIATFHLELSTPKSLILCHWPVIGLCELPSTGTKKKKKKNFYVPPHFLSP